MFARHPLSWKTRAATPITLSMIVGALAATAMGQDCNSNAVPDSQEVGVYGLVGEYYDNDDLIAPPFGSRIDARIAFDSTDSSLPPLPLRGMGEDYFSVRWRGFLLTPPGETGNYIIRVYADDGFRVWLDGDLILDEWDLGPRVASATVPLLEDRAYPIVIEYFENNNTHGIGLFWRLPSDDQSGPWPLVPTDRLLPTLDVNGNGRPDACDIADGILLDCNTNGIGDGQEIAGADVVDCNGNSIPDECETGFDSLGMPRPSDCNVNGLPDDCERGAGLLGEYFVNESLSGKPFGRRVDGPIDFDWPGDPGTGGVPSEHFSVRWSGYIRTPAESGNYAFRTLTDDGVRLWIGGQLIIDDWQAQASTWNEGTIYLPANTAFPVVLEYFERTGAAICGLYWNTPHMGGSSVVLVPAERLSPWTDCDADGFDDQCEATRNGLAGAYFNNTTLAGNAVANVISSEVDFFWEGTNGPPGVGGDNFSVRWSGYVRPDVTGDHVFITQTDDGVRLWIEDELIIDQWRHQALTQHQSPPLSLQAGAAYRIELEYFEGTGNAHAHLLWRPPGQSESHIIPSANLTPEFDCNANGSPDRCDVGNGISPDCQSDGVPDECQIGAPHLTPIQDGSFELGTPNAAWTDESTSFGSPLCTIDLCGPDNLARTGDWWAWFGGIADISEFAAVEQSLVIEPFGQPALEFHFWLSGSSQNGSDALRLLIDGVPIWQVRESDPGYEQYSRVQVSLAPFADGAEHVIRFEAAISGTGPGVTNFFIDDVAVTSLDPNPTGDCNTNGIPDECDIAAGAAGDCNANDLPDVCEPTPAIPADLSTLDTCLLGPARDMPSGCACFDLDFDGSVTLADYGVMQVYFDDIP